MSGEFREGDGKINSRMLLNYTLDYAVKSGDFHALNTIRRAGSFCVWGAGEYFIKSYERYFKNKIHIDYIVDSDQTKWGKEVIDGIQCISPEQLCKMDEPIVLPFLWNGFDEVCDFCCKNKIVWIHRSHFLWSMNCPQCMEDQWFRNSIEGINKVFEWLEDEESRRVFACVLWNRMAHGYEKTDWDRVKSAGEYYSPSQLYTLGDDENFVDVGAFDGDSILDFLKAVNYNFDHIYGLECDKDNYQRLLKKISQLKGSVKERILCLNYGAYKEKTTLYCDDLDFGSGGMVCKISSTGEGVKAEFDRVDSLLKNKKVSLIKMDIEGSEKEAVLGCESILKEQRPKLAICVYHNVGDYWEIPLLIKQIQPEYHIGMRHHSNVNQGTVCYAWIN